MEVATTHAKRRAQNVDLTPYAKRLPKPCDKCDRAKCNKGVAAHSVIQMVLTHMQKDADHALNCWKAVAELEESKINAEEANGGDYFDVKSITYTSRHASSPPTATSQSMTC